MSTQKYRQAHRESINAAQRLTRRVARISAQYCACGCGQPTMVSPTSIRAKGYVKGEPRRFRQGHSSKKYSFNEAFFDQIDTEEKAYLLGFFTGDAWISINGKTVEIGLSIKDRSLVEQIQGALGFNGPIQIRKHVQKPGRKHKILVHYSARLALSSQQLCLALARHEVFYNKTTTAVPWKGQNPLIRHYWRGLVDADGGVYNDHLTLDGTYEIASGFLAFARSICNANVKIYPGHGKNLWTVSLGARSDLFAMCHALYDKALISLPRKQEVAASNIAGYLCMLNEIVT